MKSKICQKIRKFIRLNQTEICLKTISKFNLPIWVSFNLLNSEKIRSGEKFSNAIKMIKKYSVNCLLINCNPLNRSYNALKILKNNWDNDWGLYPNLGVGEPSPNGIITAYHTNKDFLNTIQNSIDLGANVIGGCCGVSPKHINLISKLIKNNL